jgi:hypothetical protein
MALVKEVEMIDPALKLHALVLGLVCAGSATALPPRYVVTPLEHPEPNGVRTIVPWDLNDDGRVAGFAFHGYGIDLTRQPCFWQDGVVELVPVDWDFTESRCLAVDGTAYGIDLTSQALVHVTPEGITSIAATPVAYSTMMRPATASGWLAGNHYDDGFVWHAQYGYTALSTPFSSDPATVADLNEAGIVVGTFDYSRAFMWRHDEGMSDPAPELSGETHAWSVDELGRVLLSHQQSAAAFVRYAYLGDDGVSLGPVLMAFPYGQAVDARANEAGDLVATWSSGSGTPYLAMRAADSSASVEIALPPDTIAIEIRGLNEGGMAYGLIMNSDYEPEGFVASVLGGLSILNHRLIGHEPLWFYGVPRDANASGAMVITYAHNNSYSHWALIEPAQAGDVDGDGMIDVTDLLGVVDAWGPWPSGSVCGPDLDMDGAVGVLDLLEVLAMYGR